MGNAAALPPAGTVVIGSSGTLELAGLNQTIGELTGSGVVDNNSGVDVVLTLGSSIGSTWNGSIQDQGGGKVALTKNGAGTWVVGGANNLNNGSPFTTQNILNSGTTILTNGGSMAIGTLQMWIANGTGSTATMVVAGGALSVSNNLLIVGNSTNANGTLIVNSGSVIHGGGVNGIFAAAGLNNIWVGALGGTGTLIVNGGQVLNSQGVILGQNPTGSGTLYLNGGLLQATAVLANNAPATSIAYFNGGTLQATTNSGSFLQAITANVMSNGLVLDDGGWAVSIGAVSLQAGDAFGGGLVKQGLGTLYLDAGNSYTGATVVASGTLAGIGTIAGPVTVAPAASIGAGDAAALGTLNLSSTPLTLQGTAALRISKDRRCADQRPDFRHLHRHLWRDPEHQQRHFRRYGPGGGRHLHAVQRGDAHRQLWPPYWLPGPWVGLQLQYRQRRVECRGCGQQPDQHHLPRQRQHADDFVAHGSLALDSPIQFRRRRQPRLLGRYPGFTIRHELEYHH